jgi:hypothetical protein
MVQDEEIGEDEFSGDEPDDSEYWPEDGDPDDEQEAAAVSPAPRPPVWPQLPSPTPPVAARPPERSDEERLAEIKQQAMLSVPARLSAAARDTIVEQVERAITAQAYPRWESSLTHAFRAQALVDRVVGELEAAQAAKADRERKAAQAARDAADRDAAAAKRRQDLIWHGHRHANRRVLEFDPRDRYQIRQEVEAVLEREVRDDWDEGDVEQLLEETLDEWTDDED